MSLLGLGEDGPPSEICSRAGCSETAEWCVNWRNPRIHGPERVKLWLACGEHRDYLEEFLRSRDFPVAVTEIGAPLDRLPEPKEEAE